MHLNHVLTSRQMLPNSLSHKVKLEEYAEKFLLSCNLSQQKVSPQDQVASNGTIATFLLAISCDKTLLASCHGDHSIIICDIHTGHVLNRLRGHPRTPWALAFHPNIPHLLASGCLAGHVRIWDLKTSCSSLIRIESDTAITCVCFHPSLPLVAIAVSNKILLRDWQNSTGVAVMSSATKRERVRYVRFDSTGSTLYTAIANVGRAAAPGTRPMPTIMPQSFQRMLNSRRDLLVMRQDLHRRHRMLQQRYRTLLQSYHDLRAAHPQIEDVGPEPPAPPDLDLGDPPPGLPSPLFQRHVLTRNREAAQGFERATDEGNALLQLWTRTRRDVPEVPPSSRWLRTDLPGSPPAFVTPVLSNPPSIERSLGPPPTPFTWRHTNTSDNGEPRPLSPIRLEHLEDAVGYAHQLTSESMRQFRELHEASMNRIRRSCAQLFGASQILVEQFIQDTYDSIIRMNERIEEREALASTLPQHTGARALLGALIRMQRILISHHYPHSGAPNSAHIASRPLLPEIQTLVQVFDTMLSVEMDSLPTEIETDLREGRRRMREMEEQLENILSGASSSPTEEQIHERLSAEIEGFQGVMSAWKKFVLQSSTNKGTTDESDQPSTSGTVAAPTRRPKAKLRHDSNEEKNSTNSKYKKPRLANVANQPPPRIPTPIPDMQGADALFLSDIDDSNDMEIHPGPMDGVGGSVGTPPERPMRREWSQRVPEIIARRRGTHPDEAIGDRSTRLFMYVPSAGNAGQSNYDSILEIRLRKSAGFNFNNPVWAGTMLQIISLKPETRGQVLFQRTFGPNAMCLHFSPTSKHILVGLATRNYLRLTHSPETYMQVYELREGEQEDAKLKLMRSVESVLPPGNRPLDLQQELELRNCSIYCALWLPQPGLGLAYGTNKGHVFIMKGDKNEEKQDKGRTDRPSQLSALARSAVNLM